MKKRVQLYVLLALFFGPLLVAWIWFFHFKELRPGTVNEGELIQPVVPFHSLQLPERGASQSSTVFANDWFVVVLAPAYCDAACERALHVSQLVWIRLNKDADRVQRVLLAGSDVSWPAAEHPDVRVYDAPEPMARQFGDPQYIYLVDPRGNLMMRYPPDFTPDMLYKDLRRLLKYSDAG